MTLEINNVIVGGNLTRDVVIKDTATGRKVCTFTVANNRSYTSNNRKLKETAFIDAEAWGIIAENCSLYLKKGSPVVVTGRLKQSRWETAEGQKRSRLKVLASNVQFLSSGSRRQSDTECEDTGEDAGSSEAETPIEVPDNEAGREEASVPAETGLQ